jgi:hypothetical protein
MSNADHATDVAALRELLRTQAERLELDPDSVDSPSPNAITARTPDGTLLRLDISRYRPMELSL